MNFSIEGIDNVVDKLTQYASGDKIQRGLAMAGEVVRAHAVANCPVATGRLKGSIVSQVDGDRDRKSTRLNSSHSGESRMPSSA